MPDINTLILLAFTYTAGNVTIHWSGPTHNIDGSAISSPLTYNIYRTINNGSQVEVRKNWASERITVPETLLRGDRDCYYISAIENEIESTQLELSCVEKP